MDLKVKEVKLKVVLKNGKVATLTQSENISLKSLKAVIEHNPQGPMSLDDISGNFTWADIDFSATEILHKNSAL